MRSWSDNWEPAKEHKVTPGAQAKSFVVRDRTDRNRLGFVKEIDNRSRKVRARFVRETVVYETLADVGLPTLFEHNAAEAGGKGPLFLVIEFIPGGTVGDYVRTNGPVGFDQVFAFTVRVARVLRALHAEEMAHRDLKPGNIVLRGGDITDPVLVDFGLSFIDDDGELTTTNETVGNRFLSLPEYAHGGRSPASDVTQLAGVVYYLLTGLYPLGLTDGDGRKPHQTDEGRARLVEVFDGAPLRRLLAVFDRAFSMNVLDRFATVDELLAALDAVVAEEADVSDIERLRADARSRADAAGAGRRAELQPILGEAREALTRAIRATKDGANLSFSQTGASSSVSDDPPFYETRFGLTYEGTADHYVTYRVELRGAGEFVLLIDGVDAWRGNTLHDPGLVEAVERAALTAFIAAEEARQGSAE